MLRLEIKQETPNSLPLMLRLLDIVHEADEQAELRCCADYGIPQVVLFALFFSGVAFGAALMWLIT